MQELGAAAPASAAAPEKGQVTHQNDDGDFTITLLPQYRKLITDSAVADEVARARGYRSVRQKSELKRCG